MQHWCTVISISAITTTAPCSRRQYGMAAVLYDCDTTWREVVEWSCSYVRMCSVIRTVCMLWYAGAVYSVHTYVQATFCQI